MGADASRPANRAAANDPADAHWLDAHWLDGRRFRAWVPAADTRMPVVILLHGLGGTGDVIDHVVRQSPALAAAYIIVAPDAPNRSWNVDGPVTSQHDDLHYIGTTLLDHLASWPKAMSSFTLIGFSQGAAMTNRLLIENRDPRIVQAITICSQLNTMQYRDDTFYVRGSDNAYAPARVSLARRNLLNIVGGADDLVPAQGGASSKLGDGKGGKLAFVDWQNATLAYARAYGHVGPRAVPSPVGDDANVSKVSYLDGQVVGVKVQTAGHGFGGWCFPAIHDFLGLPTPSAWSAGRDEAGAGPGQGRAGAMAAGVAAPSPPRLPHTESRSDGRLPSAASNGLLVGGTALLVAVGIVLCLRLRRLAVAGAGHQWQAVVHSAHGTGRSTDMRKGF